MNQNGHAESLLPAPQGNTRAVKHGIHSPRVLAPGAQEIANALMELPHVQPLDRVAAEEIGSLCVRLERIDADLDERGHFGRSGARSLLEHKARLGRELRAWLREFGGTPRARWEFAQQLSGETIGEAIARRFRELDEAAAE